MATTEQLKKIIAPSKLIEEGIVKFAHHPTYQKLIDQYDSLNPDNKTAVRIASFSILSLILLLLTLLPIWYATHTYITAMNVEEAIQALNSGTQEIHAYQGFLSQVKPTRPILTKEDAQTSLTNLARVAKIKNSQLTIQSVSSPTVRSEVESVQISIALKKVSLRQILIFIEEIQKSKQNLTLDTLSIDTHADPEGWMDSSLTMLQNRPTGDDA